ncbi:DUF1853 family protein [Polaribacter sp.]|uniref:DUF1853 family protein n=1 Tax=Polaribacter sp. TaxID=1920175 RepID=UPI004047E1E9
MQQNSKEIQKRYEGFLQTPFLWTTNELQGLQPFICHPKFTKINLEIDENQCLGKYIERFVTFELQQQESIKIIAENIQIQQDKLTLGELDCILYKDSKPFHVEIVYKFYLYDAAVGTTEIAHWIGPNRKDSLQEKITKLTQKQLPLLYSKEANFYLKTLGLDNNQLQQQVYFKAQLFVPLDKKLPEFNILNRDCVVGFYAKASQLRHYQKAKFYIPNKKDWLVKPHPQVSWMSFDDFIKKSVEYEQQNYSPLCWLKSDTGELQKFFLVWWDTV